MRRLFPCVVFWKVYCIENILECFYGIFFMFPNKILETLSSSRDGNTAPSWHLTWVLRPLHCCELCHKMINTWHTEKLGMPQILAYWKTRYATNVGTEKLGMPHTIPPPFQNTFHFSFTPFPHRFKPRFISVSHHPLTVSNHVSFQFHTTPSPFQIRFIPVSHHPLTVSKYVSFQFHTIPSPFQTTFHFSFTPSPHRFKPRFISVSHHPLTVSKYVSFQFHTIPPPFQIAHRRANANCRTSDECPKNPLNNRGQATSTH